MTSSQRLLWDYSIDDDLDSPVPSCAQQILVPSPSQSQSQSQSQTCREPRSWAARARSVQSTLATCEQVARGADVHVALGTASGLYAATACYSTALGLLELQEQHNAGPEIAAARNGEHGLQLAMPPRTSSSDVAWKLRECKVRLLLARARAQARLYDLHSCQHPEHPEHFGGQSSCGRSENDVGECEAEGESGGEGKDEDDGSPAVAAAAISGLLAAAVHDAQAAVSIAKFDTQAADVLSTLLAMQTTPRAHAVPVTTPAAPPHALEAAATETAPTRHEPAARGNRGAEEDGRKAKKAKVCAAPPPPAPAVAVAAAAAAPAAAATSSAPAASAPLAPVQARNVAVRTLAQCYEQCYGRGAAAASRSGTLPTSDLLVLVLQRDGPYETATRFGTTMMWRLLVGDSSRTYVEMTSWGKRVACECECACDPGVEIIGVTSSERSARRCDVLPGDLLHVCGAQPLAPLARDSAHTTAAATATTASTTTASTTAATAAAAAAEGADEPPLFHAATLPTGWVSPVELQLKLRLGSGARMQLLWRGCSLQAPQHPLQGSRGHREALAARARSLGLDAAAALRLHAWARTHFAHLYTCDLESERAVTSQQQQGDEVKIQGQRQQQQQQQRQPQGHRQGYHKGRQQRHHVWSVRELLDRCCTADRSNGSDTRNSLPGHSAAMCAPVSLPAPAGAVGASAGRVLSGSIVHVRGRLDSVSDAGATNATPNSGWTTVVLVDENEKYCHGIASGDPESKILLRLRGAFHATHLSAGSIRFTSRRTTAKGNRHVGVGADEAVNTDGLHRLREAAVANERVRVAWVEARSMRLQYSDAMQCYMLSTTLQSELLLRCDAPEGSPDNYRGGDPLRRVVPDLDGDNESCCGSNRACTGSSNKCSSSRSMHPQTRRLNARVLDLAFRPSLPLGGADGGDGGGGADARGRFVTVSQVMTATKRLTARVCGALVEPYCSMCKATLRPVVHNASTPTPTPLRRVNDACVSFECAAGCTMDVRRIVATSSSGMQAQRPAQHMLVCWRYVDMLLHVALSPSGERCSLHVGDIVDTRGQSSIEVSVAQQMLFNTPACDLAPAHMAQLVQDCCGKASTEQRTMAVVAYSACAAAVGALRALCGFAADAGGGTAEKHTRANATPRTGTPVWLDVLQDHFEKDDNGFLLQADGLRVLSLGFDFDI